MLKEQLHKKFTCTNSENCNIDSANRTNCKFCRFAKCLRVGMTLEGSLPSMSTLFTCMMETCLALYTTGVCFDVDWYHDYWPSVSQCVCVCENVCYGEEIGHTLRHTITWQ